MKIRQIKELFPSRLGAGLAVASAILLILAFPGFEFAPVAYVACVPLLFAIERENGAVARSFLLGWIFGTVFFIGTCWWLTFAPITYAGFPVALAYFLLLLVCMIVGLFPAMFAAIMAVLYRRFATPALFAAPFVWVFTEFLRYWLTGNNWNAVGYSQAFGWTSPGIAGVGGVSLVSWLVVYGNVVIIFLAIYSFLVLRAYRKWGGQLFKNIAAINEGEKAASLDMEEGRSSLSYKFLVPNLILFVFFYLVTGMLGFLITVPSPEGAAQVTVIAVQPNVPMSGLTYQKWQQLRRSHAVMAEKALLGLDDGSREKPVLVIFPESPMNFQYTEDDEFRQFIGNFAKRNNVSVLFNSAEPDAATGKYFNSAVMIDANANKTGQYDKIYLVPFGETVPAPFESLLPTLVGSFARGGEYDILPIGDAKAGVMICFESHFGQLGREFVLNGADVLVEMTNDGYLGPTPVLRQHLANAVFRALETNRPVLRVTNVGITAYINAKGDVIDAAKVYQEDTRIWSVPKSDGSQTFYVRYGDWFAWLCTVVTFLLLGVAVFRNVDRQKR